MYVRLSVNQFFFFLSEAHDLLSYLGVYKLPLGVYHVHDRPGAFNITTRAKLFSPLSDIYPHELPQDFSVMLSIKFRNNFEGYFFTLSDLAGKQRVALRRARRAGNSVIRFEFYDDKDLSGKNAPEFETEVKDNFWHLLAFGVYGTTVELHLDCDEAVTKDFRSPDPSPMSNSLMLSLGPYYARYGDSFEVI